MFLVGILILPLGLPSLPALLIVFAGATAIVAAFESLRSRERTDGGLDRSLSRGARLTIAGALAFAILYALIVAFTQGSQT